MGSGTGSKSEQRIAIIMSVHERNISESRLERSSHREFEIMRGLMNGERRPGYRPKECLIDARRIKGKIHPERCVQHGHHNLKLNSRAHAQAGVGSRQELRGQV